MGARPTYEANEAVTIYFTVKSAGVRQTGLTGTISIEVFDEAGVSFATPAETELGTTGIYLFTFTPDAAGYWPFTIDESSLPWEGGGVIEVVAENNATKLDDLATDIAALNDLDAQAVRDALKLAPTAGAPAAGSVDEHLDDILADTAAIEPLVTANLDDSISNVRADIAALNDVSVAEIWDELTAGHVTAGSFAVAITDILADTAAMQPTIATNLDATISSVIAAIAGLNDLDAQAVRDALKLAPTAGAPAAGSVDEHLDDILADTAAIEPLVTANLDAAISLVLSTGGAGPWTTGAAAPSAATVAAAVWNSLTASHVGAGSFGLALGTTGPADRAAILAAIAALNDPTLAAIVAGVWDELLAGHVIPGSAGATLAAAGGGATPATIAAAVWNSLLTAHVAAGSFGLELQTIRSQGGPGPWTTGAGGGGSNVIEGV